MDAALQISRTQDVAAKVTMVLRKRTTLAPLAVVAAGLDYRRFRYEVTDLGLYVASGWLWRSHQVVPHARVQTVDTTAGPLLRAFGLVSVHVRTASAHGGTSIPGLTFDVADRLVEELARRAGIEEGT